MEGVKRIDRQRRPWRARYRAPGGREVSRTFAREVDAEKWLRAERRKLDIGDWTDPAAGMTLFKDVADRWAATRRHVRASTAARDESLMRSRVLPTFGDVPVGRLRVSDLEEWVSGLVAAGLAPSTVVKCWQLAGQVLRLAVRDGLLVRSPARDVKLPALDRADPMFITDSQILDLADAIGPQWRALVLLGGYGGFRFGEMAGLKVDDIAMLRRKVSIRRTASEVKGKVTVGPPKSKAAIRTVTVPQLVVDAVAARMTEWPPPAAGWVFSNGAGGPVGQNGWRKRVWRPAVERVGFDGLTPHDLRHSHVAMLIDQGENPKAIAARLGHTSVRTVLDVYGHLLPGSDEDVADRLAERLDTAAAAHTRHTDDAEVVELRNGDTGTP